MGIITSFYNATFNIYRVTVAPTSDMGEVSAEQYALSSSSVTGRLGSSKSTESSSEGAFKGPGAGYGNLKKLFVPYDTNIKSGDKIVEVVSSVESTTEIYIVDNVNTRPGGLTDHHLECIVTKSSTFDS